MLETQKYGGEHFLQQIPLRAYEVFMVASIEHSTSP